MSPRLTSIAYPVSLSWEGYPKTLRKPGIACNDPTAARSNPYCIFAMETRQHKRRHFRFCQRVVEDKAFSIMEVTVLESVIESKSPFFTVGQRVFHRKILVFIRLEYLIHYRECRGGDKLCPNWWTLMRWTSAYRLVLDGDLLNAGMLRRVTLVPPQSPQISLKVR